MAQYSNKFTNFKQKQSKNVKLYVNANYDTFNYITLKTTNIHMKPILTNIASSYIQSLHIQNKFVFNKNIFCLIK